MEPPPPTPVRLRRHSHGAEPPRLRAFCPARRERLIRRPGQDADAKRKRNLPNSAPKRSWYDYEPVSERDERFGQLLLRRSRRSGRAAISRRRRKAAA